MDIFVEKQMRKNIQKISSEKRYKIGEKEKKSTEITNTERKNGRRGYHTKINTATESSIKGDSGCKADEP